MSPTKKVATAPAPGTPAKTKADPARKGAPDKAVVQDPARPAAEKPAKAAAASEKAAPVKAVAAPPRAGPAKKVTPASVNTGPAAKKPAAAPGPYASDTKFLDEQRQLLIEERAVYLEQAHDLKAEADSLAQEREPGDVQFDEESGEGGTVTVDRERDLALSAQALLAVEEIDDAMVRIDNRTYGACERCHQPIPKPRLRALPYARLCVACKSGGLFAPLSQPAPDAPPRAPAGRCLATALVVAGLVVVADQVTTSLAEAHLRGPVHVLGPFGLDLAYNTGSAFSLFTGAPALLALVAGAAVVALVWAARRAGRQSVAVALGLILGGALGNLGDRLFRGHHGAVVDFVTLTHWPTFNVADACITVGAVLLVVLLSTGGHRVSA